MRLIYPSGQEVRKSYDALGRATEVLDGQSCLIASYNYGSGAQIIDQQLGNVLKATFTYEPGRDRLSSIIYRSIDTGEIIEGSKRHYDAVRNLTDEKQLGRGKDSSDRYFYDSANRLIKAQYGVKHLSDSGSSFEEEVLYELYPTGVWQLRTTRDANGQTLKEDAGKANMRETYLSLGNSRFEYDANGNRILEEIGEDKENVQKRYAYDYANRLVGVENLDAHHKVIQTIEYSYDAFNHQVLKRITKDDETREYVRIWNGSQLIEEWQDGKLAKSFTYGAGVNEPLKMSLSSEREPKDYLYLLNGGGSVAALTDQHGKIVEACRYDAFGQPSLSVQNDQEINQPILSSTVGNCLLAGAQLYDFDAGVSVRSSQSYDPKTAQTVDDPNVPLGPIDPGVSLPPGLYTPDPREELVGGMSKGIPVWEAESDGNYPASIPANAAVVGIILIPTAEVAAALAGRVAASLAGREVAVAGAASKTARAGLTGGAKAHIAWELFWGIVEHFGHPIGDSGSGSSGDSSQGHPEDSNWPSDGGEPPQGTVTDVTGTSEALQAGERFQGADGNTYEIDQYGNANPVGTGGDGGFGDGGEGGGGEGGGGEGGSGCFIAGTLVALGDGRTKPIETVKVGDYVLSRDETMGNTTEQRVVSTWIHKVKATLLLHLTNGEKVETTKEHRFSVANQGFVGAGWLAPGALLNTRSVQSVKVTGIEPREQSTTVYNLEVENFHTYFVGKDGVWVHNLKDKNEGKGGGDDWGPEGP